VQLTEDVGSIDSSNLEKPDEPAYWDNIPLWKQPNPFGSWFKHYKLSPIYSNPDADKPSNQIEP
jgi:hypothetical protein